MPHHGRSRPAAAHHKGRNSKRRIHFSTFPTRSLTKQERAKRLYLSVRLAYAPALPKTKPTFAMRLWIKDPLAILAADAERGVVVEGTQIVECVPRGQSPTVPPDTTFNASRHVVLPGLINAHHHFYQTLTRAHPAGFGKELHSLARDDGARLGPHDPRGPAPRDPDGVGRTHAVRLHDRGRSSQSLSPEPEERDRHRGRGGDEARASA